MQRKSIEFRGNGNFLNLPKGRDYRTYKLTKKQREQRRERARKAKKLIFHWIAFPLALFIIFQLVSLPAWSIAGVKTIQWSACLLATISG